MMEYSEIGNRLNGFYRGQVVKHLANGQCKVYVPGVYPSKYSTTDQADNLPDAEQISPLFGGSNKGNGVFSYPNLGSVVIVGFWNGDQNLPFFFGSTLGGPEAKKQYTESRSETSDTSVNQGDDARIHKIVVDKTTIKIWESGHIQIKTFNDRKYNVEDDASDVGCQVDIAETGTVNVKASTQIHLEAPEIQMDTNQFTINSQTFKLNNAYDTQVFTEALLVDSTSEIDVFTNTKIDVSYDSNYTISPTISIDGKQGTVGIFGKNHPPIFV